MGELMKLLAAKIAASAANSVANAGKFGPQDNEDLDIPELMKALNKYKEQQEPSAAETLEEKIMESNRETAEDMGDPEVHTSDAKLKRMYKKATGKTAPKDISLEEKEAGIATGIPFGQAKKGKEKEEEAIPVGTAVTQKEDSSKDVRLSSDLLNQRAQAAATTDVIGKIIAGVIGTVGDAGAIHPEKFGGSAKETAQWIASVTKSISLGQRQAIARDAMEKERDRAALQITKIEENPQLTEEEKQEYIRGVRRSYDTEINQIMRALGLVGESGTSDARVKNVKPSGKLVARMLRNADACELSDGDYKNFADADPLEVARGILAMGKPYSGSELQFLHDIAKEHSGEEYAYDVKDAGIWAPETLDGYARYIKNSVYTYKPEATKVDPSIDPEEKHIGPMAQEIEKVNEACVKETPERVKKVDTGRLALMNAGAIGDLARQNNMQAEAIEGLVTALNQLKEALGLTGGSSVHDLLMKGGQQISQAMQAKEAVA